MKRRAGRGRLEQLLFSFMGPPQLGGGESRPLLPPSAPCARCGRAYDLHVVREPGLTYLRCPRE